MNERKRFTKNRNGVNVIPLRNAVCGVDMPNWEITKANDNEMFLSGDAADKLAHYEEAEADGRLIAPPVKVGQTVWVIVGRMLPHIAECEVIAVAQHYMNLDDKRKVFTFSVVSKGSTTPATFIDSDIGVRVFFTKEMAEITLAARRGR